MCTPKAVCSATAPSRAAARARCAPRHGGHPERQNTQSSKSSGFSMATIGTCVGLWKFSMADAEAGRRMMRLETLSEDLMIRLRQACPSQRRLAALAACAYAVEYAQVHDSAVLSVLGELNSARGVAASAIEKVKTLLEQADKQYFDLHDASDSSEDIGCLAAFSRARALSAMLFVVEEESLRSSSEAIYEAVSAVDDASAITLRVVSALV